MIDLCIMKSNQEFQPTHLSQLLSFFIKTKVIILFYEMKAVNFRDCSFVFGDTSFCYNLKQIIFNIMIDKAVNESEVLESINLTAQLQKSLRKLLSNAKTLSPEQAKTKQKSTFRAQQQQKSQRQQTNRTLKTQLFQLKRQNQELKSDNEYLSEELIKYKQQNANQKHQLNSLNKYVKFLQDYNNDLKKEMIYWMRKPQKIKMPNMNDPHKSVDQLIKEVISLRKENEAKDNKLQDIRNSYVLSNSKPKAINMNLNREDIRLSINRNEEDSFKLSIKNRQTEQNTCTSCHYRCSHQISESKSKFKGRRSQTDKKNTKNPSKTLNLHNLCKCHKKYLQTSKFQL